MNYKQHILVLHFLHMLRERANIERLTPIKKACLYILPREELLAIIHHMTDGLGHVEDPDFETMSDYALLEWIEDQYYILDYLIAKLEEEIEM